MPRNYASPRYHKKEHTGRKPLAPGRQRVHITARVSPESAKYLRQQDARTGAVIDRLIKEKLINEQAEFENNPKKPACETMITDGEDGSDMVIEMARGLLAMVVERGTKHLTIEHIEMLSGNFQLLINNYSGTFKKVTTVRKNLF